jgi:hypothetical protein
MDVMRVTIQLPDDISAALEEQWDDVPRRSLEAIAIEAYRSGALTESQVRRLWGSSRGSRCTRCSRSTTCHCSTRLRTSRTICKRNESSEFSPADDRRGRQRAAALSN